MAAAAAMAALENQWRGENGGGNQRHGVIRGIGGGVSTWRQTA
jgi:hypothetical protein